MKLKNACKSEMFDIKTLVEAPSIDVMSNTDALVFFLRKEGIPSLAKMNVPEAVVKIIQQLGVNSAENSKSVKLTEFFVLQNEKLQKVVIACFGGKAPSKPNDLRKAAGDVARILLKEKVKNAIVIAPILLNPTSVHYLRSMTEGLLLGQYSFTECKSADNDSQKLALTVISKTSQSDSIVEECCLTAEAVAYARDLINRPGNVVNPDTLAEKAQICAERYHLDYEKLDVEALSNKGMNAILAVGQGSVNPPCIVTLKYNGGGDKPYVAFVGKGITFDSGGISIKPSDNMGEMKDDMSGAADVLAVISAVARMGLPCNLMAVLACAENMPSGTAQRPGDIVKAASGKTIEVISTDAEGRMVLADAVWYACQQGAEKIVDIATLTGGVIIALGTITSGIVGNNDELIQAIINAGKQAGESFWHMPSLPECAEAIKSDVADLRNSAGREASCITGGLFIGEFVEENIPWAHIDIGGTATASKTDGYMIKGATAFGVRTLINLAKEL